MTVFTKVHILSYMSTLLTDRKYFFLLRTCQRLSETDLMFYLHMRIMKLFLLRLTSFDVTVGRSKFILVFAMQLHNQIPILNQCMCTRIILGHASPCDCISLWGGSTSVTH